MRGGDEQSHTSLPEIALDNRKTTIELDSTEIEQIVIIEREPSLFGPLIEILGLLCILVWCSWTLINFFVGRPVFEPTHSSRLLCYSIIGFFTADIVFQFLVAIATDITILTHGRFIFNVLIHHCLSLLCIIAALVYDNNEFYALLMGFLTVEFNTFLLKIRRIIDREKLRYKLVNVLFLFSWFLQRLVVFPCLTAYICWIWYREGMPIDLLLASCLCCLLLVGLYVLWTLALLGKSCNKKVLEANIALAEEPRKDSLTDAPTIYDMYRSSGSIGGISWGVRACAEKTPRKSDDNPSTPV